MKRPPGGDDDSAWVELDGELSARAWDAFKARFGFWPSTRPSEWPAIREPTPSITFDLADIQDGPQRAAAYDAINAEALRCFVWSLPDVSEMTVLDWQHPAYRFDPSQQALTWRPDWAVPVYPNGDYYIFVNADMSEGTFGHPWEQTLCVMGPRLTASLGRSLAAWLPIKRRDGA
jgi:hypothetical protein